MRRFAADQQPIDQQTDDDKIAIEQPARDVFDVLGHGSVERRDQLLDRHRGKKVIAVIVGQLTGFCIFDCDARDAVSLDVQPLDFGIGDDAAAAGEHFLGHEFPHLARP